MLGKNHLKFPFGRRVYLEPLPETNGHSAELKLVVFRPMANRHHVGLTYRLINLFLIKCPCSFYGVYKDFYLTIARSDKLVRRLARCSLPSFIQ